MSVAGPHPLALNGKWLAQELTGTQRYAAELTAGLLPRLEGRPALHVPADATVPEQLAAATDVQRSRLRGTAFEQLALPWVARRAVLLSLGGPAPLLARTQVATMHDAAVFRLPQTHSRAFGLWYRLMYRVIARRAQTILTVSRFSCDELAGALRVPTTRFRVIPDGADHLDGVVPVKPEAAVPSRPFALMVGGPSRHKNVAPVAEALAETGVPVVVVGGGTSTRVFGSDVGAPTHTAGVTRLGRVSDAEMAWLYQQAAVLVFPSLYEGFGLPVVEAQRQGCPVVCSDRASLPEVAGDAAVLVDATHPHTVVAAVRSLLDDPSSSVDRRAAGRRNAERFTWDRSSETLAAVLAERGVAMQAAPGQGRRATMTI